MERKDKGHPPLAYQWTYPTVKGQAPGLRKMEEVSKEVLAAMVAGGYDMNRQSIEDAINYSAAYLDELERRFGCFEQPTPDWDNQIERSNENI